MKESTQAILEVLSLEQERMFFLSQLHGDTAALHEYEAVWIHGEIDDTESWMKSDSNGAFLT